MKVKHPNINGLVIDVEKNEAEEYLAAGWLEVSKRRNDKATEVVPKNDSPATDEN